MPNLAGQNKELRRKCYFISGVDRDEISFFIIATKKVLSLPTQQCAEEEQRNNYDCACIYMYTHCEHTYAELFITSTV